MNEIDRPHRALEDRLLEASARADACARFVDDPWHEVADLLREAADALAPEQRGVAYQQKMEEAKRWKSEQRGERPLYRQYRRTAIAEMADWHLGFDMTGVSISDADRKAGSPKLGDKIARNPANHEDRWLVAADYFAANFAPITGGPDAE
jgi:hypothetical protein